MHCRASTRYKWPATCEPLENLHMSLYLFVVKGFLYEPLRIIMMILTRFSNAIVFGWHDFAFGGAIRSAFAFFFNARSQHSHVQWHLSAPKLPNQTLQTHSVDNICLTRPSMILEVSTACFQIKTASASLPISSNIMMERCVSESCLCSRFVYLQRCLLRVVALNLPFLGSVLW